MKYVEPSSNVSFFDEIVGSSNRWESDIDPDVPTTGN